MSWNTYWQAQLDGIEETEQHSDRTWQAALALLLLWERRLRRRAAALIADLPTDGGRLSALAFSARVQFRSALAKIVDDFATGASLAIAGVPGAPVVRAPAAGLQRKAVEDAVRIAEAAIKRASDVLAADIAAEAARQAAPVVLDAEAASEAAAAAAARERLLSLPKRRSADVDDLMVDAADNPPRQLAYEGHRVAETVKRLVSRHGTKDEAMAYVLGGDE